jgi:hypothetical protein
MSLDRDVIDAVREMDEHDLRRLLMLAKARLEKCGETFGSAAPNVHLRRQWVKCGKPNCSRCPHGPYWYAHWREDGRRRSRYVGKLGDETLNRVPSPSEKGGIG